MIERQEITSNQRVLLKPHIQRAHELCVPRLDSNMVTLRTSRIQCTLLIILILAAVVPVTTGYATSSHWQDGILAFSRNLLLSTDDSHYDHHVEVSVAISDNGTIFAGWKNSDLHNGPGLRVSIVKSVDGGTTWTEPFDMPMFGGEFTHQSDPWLYWHDGSIYYAYLEFEPDYFLNTSDPDFFTQITVAKSDDYGHTWTTARASNGTYFADKETMMVSEDGTVYVVYDDVNVDTEDGNATVRFTQSTDGGETFQEVSVIDEDPGYVGPFVAQNSTGGLFVAWTWLDSTFTQGAILLSRSTDSGITWDGPRVIDTGGNHSAATAPGGRPGKTTLPVLRFDDTDRLYLIWSDIFEPNEHSWDVYLCYSDDSGETWSSRTQVNAETSGNQWNPDAVIGPSGRLHIAYYDERHDAYLPFYRTVEFTGVERGNPVFSREVPVADDLTSGSFTRPGEYLGIQLDENEAPLVAWSDGRDNEMDIYYAHGLNSTDLPIPYEVIVVTVVVVGAVIVIALVLYIRRR